MSKITRIETELLAVGMDLADAREAKAWTASTKLAALQAALGRDLDAARIEDAERQEQRRLEQESQLGETELVAATIGDLRSLPPRVLAAILDGLRDA